MNFDLTSLEQYSAPKIQDYIAVIGKVTRVMNLRIVKKQKSDKFPYSSIFECGVDVMPLANGGNIIITTLGFFAFSFEEFVERFLEYQRIEIKKRESTLRYFGQTSTVSGVGFIFTDDTDSLSTFDYDEDGSIIDHTVKPEYVEDEKLLNGLKSYESLNQFIEALPKS